MTTIDERATTARQRMTDDQLRQLHRDVEALVCTHAGATTLDDALTYLQARPEASPAAVWLLWRVLAPLDEELGLRHQYERDAAVAIEANGHELFVGVDEALERRGEPAWKAFCHCGADLGEQPTRDAAVAAGEAHIAAEGAGTWNHEWSD